jgi:hypothetical protein
MRKVLLAIVGAAAIIAGGWGVFEGARQLGWIPDARDGAAPGDSAMVADAAGRGVTAANQFMTLAASSTKPGGLAPRESDPKVKALLDAAFNARAIAGRKVAFNDLDPLQSWLFALAGIGQTYLMAGMDPAVVANANDPAVAAQIQKNVVQYAPEFGRYMDAQLTLMAVELSAVSTEIAAHPTTATSPQGAHGLQQVRGGALQSVAGAVSTLATPGLTDAWRRARLPAIKAIAPEAARLLLPDQKAALRQTIEQSAGAITDPAVKAELAAVSLSIG